LRVLEEALVTEAQLDQVNYLRGHLAKLSGELPDALALWEAVAVVGDRPARAKAAFARVNAMLEDQSIKPDEAIEELEALRFAWRNDVFEFDLLHRLGRLHADNKNYRNALLTFRQAATYYSDIKGARALTDEMSEVFKKFYDQGDADELPPISALGIFQEFRELTPSGEEGDKLIARLAERLIKVDLLSQAGDLLEHQVVHRLNGHAKAEVGLRVAKIRLMDNTPEKSLDALAKSVVADLPAQLERQRTHAKAVALSRLNKPDEALRLIASDTSDEADELRADILWNAKRWRRASRILARLTGALSTKKIDRKSARQMLRRAVALALSKDDVGIGFLRERFGAAMEKSAYAEAFKAVVGNKPVDTDDYRILAREASELSVFLAFRRSELVQSRKSPPTIN
jgi:tetratricopeptide (TPR) repeat protein